MVRIMQCRRCSFENVPGQPRCLRCGAALAAPEGVSTVPPRATGSSGFRRAIYRLSRIRVGGLPGLRAVLDRLRAPDTDTPLPVLDLLFASIIPGVAQFRLGRTARGWAFLLGWLGLMLAGILHPWLIGMAAGVHASAAADAFTDRLTSPLRRIVTPLAFLVGLWLVLYWPVTSLVGRYYFRQYVPAYTVLSENIPSAEVLVLFTTRVGDRPDRIVDYRLRQAAYGDGRIGYRIETQHGLGFVVAVAGDIVSFNREGLLVNGAGAPLSNEAFRRNPIRWPPALKDVTYTVPPGSLFIVPPEIQNLNEVPQASLKAAISEICIVNRADVNGTAYMILSPLNRLRFL